MRNRNLRIAAVALLAVGFAACDFTGGSKYDHRFSVFTWDDIDNECFAIGTYVMGIDFSSNPARAKSQIKIKTENRDDREFLPSLLELRYTLTRGIDASTLYNISYPLNNGKGKSQFILPPLSLLVGDEIDVEACANGGSVPLHSQVDWRVSFKFDKDF